MAESAGKPRVGSHPGVVKSIESVVANSRITADDGGPGRDLPKADQRGGSDFDASQHRREGAEAEEIVHPADEKTVRDQRLDAHRLVREFHRADPREHHHEAPAYYRLAQLFDRDDPLSRSRMFTTSIEVELMMLAHHWHSPHRAGTLAIN
jgi:hypothetical protein